MLFARRAQSCVLRTYLSKPSVIFGTRCDYTSSLCKWNLHGERNGPSQRHLSTTEVGKPEFASAPAVVPAAKKLDHEDKERRIMVVLRRKKGELVPQLHEEDLLDYFSAYGEIEDVTWVRTKETDLDTGKGYGFVSFTSAASLKQAVASKNHTLSGRQVFVFPASARRSSERPVPAQVATVQGVPGQSESVGKASGQTASEQMPPTQSVSAQAVSAWIASTGTVSAQTAFAKEVPPLAASSLAASAEAAAVRTGPVQTASAQTLSARTKAPEDDRRKILVTRRKGCGGQMTLKNVHDYFSAFGKIELVHETKDLIYITFENADSVERVMFVPHHVINDVMVLISLAYSNKQRKQLRLEKAMDEAKVKQNPRNMKIAEKQGRKIVFMTPTRFKDSINKKSLEDYFSSYGAIEHIFLMESKGYGFVIFEDANVAERVLEDGDHKVDNTEIYVKMSLASHKNQSSQEVDCKIFVSNISGETSEKDIWKHFSKFGKVAEVVFANKHDSSNKTDSCIVAFESVHGGMGSLVDAFHQISTQTDALVVKVGEDKFLALSNVSKLHVSDIPEDMTLEMLRDYFERFGFIQYIGFTNYHSEKVLSTLKGVSVAFCQESALEKALNESFHEINGYKLKVKKANRSFAGRPSDILSLRVLITNLPENLDELVVKDYLLGQSCRVKSVRFLSPTVCIASLWNLCDVNRLVKIASSNGHVIGGNPVSLRRLHWVKEQDGGLELDDTIGPELFE